MAEQQLDLDRLDLPRVAERSKGLPPDRWLSSKVTLLRDMRQRLEAALDPEGNVLDPLVDALSLARSKEVQMALARLMAAATDPRWQTVHRATHPRGTKQLQAEASRLVESAQKVARAILREQKLFQETDVGQKAELVEQLLSELRGPPPPREDNVAAPWEHPGFPAPGWR